MLIYHRETLVPRIPIFWLDRWRDRRRGDQFVLIPHPQILGRDLPETLCSGVPPQKAAAALHREKPHSAHLSGKAIGARLSVVALAVIR